MNLNIEKELLNRLLYSEVFSHPLSRLELKRSIINCSEEEIDQSLSRLLDNKLISQKDDVFYVFDENDKVEERANGINNASQLLSKAHRVGRKIYRFPYVKGVGISGSLSKGVLHDGGDFDYFIVTEPSRLWLARTLLILYKKIFLLNSRKYFCVNYFVDTDNLEIEEKNAFTSTEIASMILVVGSAMPNFVEHNKWIGEFAMENDKSLVYDSTRKPLVTKVITGMTRGRLGEWLDEKFMRMTMKRWKKKFGDFESDTFDLTMKSRKYVSKHHPNNFQTKVLNRFMEKKSQFVADNRDKLTELSIEL